MNLNETHPIQEITPWLIQLTDGVVICKDSSLFASYQIHGIDGDSSTVNDIAAAVESIEEAVNVLKDSPVTFYWTVRRTRTEEYPKGIFANTYSQMLDDEQRAEFLSGNNFMNRHFLTIALHPERGSDRFMSRVSQAIKEGDKPLAAMVKAAKSLLTDRESFAWEVAEISGVLKDFEENLASATSALSSVSPRRLRGGEMLGFLSSCINPDRPGALDVKYAKQSDFLDSLLPEEGIEVGDNILKIGQDTYAAALSIKSWPDVTDCGAMDALLSVPCQMTVTQVFRLAGKDETSSHIENTKRFNGLLKYPLKSWIISAFSRSMNEESADPARARAIAECIEAKGEITDQKISFGWYATSVVLFAKTERAANEMASTAELKLQTAGLPGIVRENIGLLSAFAATLPGQIREIQRWSFLSSHNMGDLAPIRTIVEGERINAHLSAQTGKTCEALTVFPTDFSTPYYFNFHSGDLGHTMVLGPSRSGKSVLMNFLIAMFMKYGNCRAIIFDKDHSCRIPTLLQGGDYIDLCSIEDGSIQFNPLAMVTGQEHWPFLAKWIEGLICSRGYEFTSEDVNDLNEAIESVSEDSNPEHHRLMSIYTQLPGHLKSKLEPWVGNKPLARYFDNTEDKFSISSFCGIEIGQLLRDPILARAFMDYAFYRIQKLVEENRKGSMTPTMIYLEECWFMLENPQFAERIRDWLKTLAKLNCFVVMATQSLEDIVEANSTIFSALRDNVPTRIFLPNREAGSESLARLYRQQFGLTNDQIEKVRKAKPKRNYFIVKPDVARMVTCQFTKRQLAILRSDAAAQKIFNRHYQSVRHDWAERYMEEVNDV